MAVFDLLDSLFVFASVLALSATAILYLSVKSLEYIKSIRGKHNV